MIKIYVPLDSAAVALGADEVAEAILDEAQKRDASVQMVRNGSRGMHWLEPLVEVEQNGKRIGFANVDEGDVASLFEADFLTKADHQSCIGEVDAHPFLAKQERLTFARCGIIDPLDLDAYAAQGGLAGLKRAIELSCEEIVGDVMLSGLRGRGGAGFPEGIKWTTGSEAEADQQ